MDRIFKVVHQVYHRCAHVLIVVRARRRSKQGDRKATARPDLIAHQPHSADYGPITEELAALTSHYHPLYAQDNGNVYDRIERAFTGTSHSSAIILFRHTRDGKGAMYALVSRFSGKVVRESRIKDSPTLV